MCVASEMPVAAASAVHDSSTPTVRGMYQGTKATYDSQVTTDAAAKPLNSREGSIRDSDGGSAMM